MSGGLGDWHYGDVYTSSKHGGDVDSCDECRRSTRTKIGAVAAEGTAPGVKLDTGKPRWDLLPWRALRGVVDVLTFGAKKYCDNGWQSVPGGRSRYTAALLRHLAAHEQGEVLDPDSGLPHLAHVATNALFLLHLLGEMP